MPELPELDAVVGLLRGRTVGRRVSRFDIVAFSVLKTAEPPHESLVGRTVTSVTRRGKFLLLEVDGRYAVVHLALAGWVKTGDETLAKRPSSSGPLAFRLTFDDGTHVDFTEQGRKKSLALWITDDPLHVERVARLGPEADAITAEEFVAMLARSSSRLKTVLTDQTMLAGIGNAWSDEVLHRARLSPFATANRLSSPDVQRLFDALGTVIHEVRTRLDGVPLDRIKSTKRSLFRVHARTGEPCPVCGTPVAEVSYADRSLQYCPGCQTGGKRLSDRRMDRLLK